MYRSKLFAALMTAGLAPLAGALLVAPPTPAAAAAGAGTSPGTGAPPGTGAGGVPILSATVEQCVTAANQSGRSVTFAGQMETVAGAHELAIQVVVQERAPEAESFHTLTSGGLGAWQHSEPGVSIYKVRQNVTDLPAPAAYRAIVRYRWLDERGNVIRREARRTPVCRQPVVRHRP